MIAATTAAMIEGYAIVAYKGTAQGETFDEFLRSAESLGANAILNTCYDDALDVDTLFHGAAVVIGPIPETMHRLTAGASIFAGDQQSERTLACLSQVGGFSRGNHGLPGYKF